MTFNPVAITRASPFGHHPQRKHLRRAVCAACAPVAMTALVTMAAMMSSTAQAQGYRVELKGGGSFSDMDRRTQATGYSASATYYLQPVQTVASIIAESAFLNKASSATLGYTGVNQDFGLDNTESDTEIIELSARYVLNEKYIFEAAVADGEEDPDSAPKTDISSFGIGVGQYIDDLTSIVLNYTQEDIEGEDSNRDNVMLRLKSIVDPSETARAVGTVAAGVTQNAVANTIINLDAAMDYYFGPRISVGASLGLRFPNNGADENAYGLRSEVFVTERISVSAAYTHTIFHEEDDQDSMDASDSFVLALKGRI